MSVFKKYALLLSSMVGLVFSTSSLADQEIKMATIALGSSAYQVMTTMASIIHQTDLGLDITVDATGAATKHQLELAQGKIDLAMSAPQIYHFMKNGTLMYQRFKSTPKLSQNVGLLFWFPYGASHVLTYADSGIKTLNVSKVKKSFWDLQVMVHWQRPKHGSKPQRGLCKIKITPA